MKKVLIFTSDEGHLSIAKAIFTLLKTENLLPEIVDLWSTDKRFKMYLPFYRYFPSLFKIPYKLGEQAKVAQATKMVVEKLLEKGVKKEVKDKQPDLIISTNLFYNPALGKILDYQKIPIPYLNIITNPWNIHPLELSPTATFNLFYDEFGVKVAKKYKIPAEKLVSLGWFVRSEFYQSYNLTNIRKGFGFKSGVFTLLICGGSEGSNMILKIIPALLGAKKPIQAILVCGTNKTLYNASLAFQKIMPKLSKLKANNGRLALKVKIQVIRFTDKLSQLMSIADLVIGKAGPNLLFESVAAKKPFFAICHISGQEDNNLKLIKKKGLGFVEENPFKAIKLLNKIIINPKILGKFKKNINKVRQENLQTNLKFTQLVNKLLNENH